MLEVEKNDGGYLLSYAFYNKNNRHIWDLDLCVLNSNETELNQGRFALFTKEEQQFKAILRMGASFDETKYKLTRIFNWIAENTTAPWSFDVRAEDAHNIQIIFSFQNDTTAVTLKLVWT